MGIEQTMAVQAQNDAGKKSSARRRWKLLGSVQWQKEEAYFRKQSWGYVTFLALMLALGVGYADYLTGPDFSLSVFYFGPIFVAAWFAGRWAGVLLAVVSAAVWHFADLAGGALYFDSAAASWNTFARAAMFLVVAFILGPLSRFQDQLETVVAERTAALTAEIMERMRAEQQQRASEQRFQQLAESVAEVFWLSDPQKNQILYVSPAYERIWGRPCESLYASARSWLEAIHLEDRDHVCQAAQTKQASGEYDEEYRIIRPDGTVRWIRDRAFPVRDATGKVYRIAGIADDITEAKNLEMEILTVRRNEQQRIGQDLHDGLGQHLTGTELRMKVLQKKLAEKSLPEAFDAQQIAEFINQAIAQTRELSRGLFPVSQEVDGLVSALDRLASNQQQMCGVSCQFSSQEGVLIYDNEAATQLYRITQEAVNNAVKHSNAKHIRISLAAQNGLISLTVEDDGVGFPSQESSQDGSGLRIMNYRARRIGGTLEIRGKTGGGTTVSCIIPRIGVRLDAK